MEAQASERMTMQIQIETTIRFTGRRPQVGRHAFELRATFSCPHHVAQQLRGDARRIAVDCPIMDWPDAMLVWWVEQLQTIADPERCIALLSVDLPDGSTTYSWHAE